VERPFRHLPTRNLDLALALALAIIVRHVPVPCTRQRLLSSTVSFATKPQIHRTHLTKTISSSPASLLYGGNVLTLRPLSVLRTFLPLSARPPLAGGPGRGLGVDTLRDEAETMPSLVRLPEEAEPGWPNPVVCDVRRCLNGLNRARLTYCGGSGQYVGLTKSGRLVVVRAEPGSLVWSTAGLTNIATSIRPPMIATIGTKMLMGMFPPPVSSGSDDGDADGDADADVVLGEVGATVACRFSRGVSLAYSCGRASIEGTISARVAASMTRRDMANG
jgi:hypothetical protein